MIRSFVARTTLLLCLLAGGASAGTIYVNANLASGANNGTSWADAFQGSNGVQAAMAIAIAGDDLWVAQGNYEPTAGATRSIYFPLRNGVSIYGGFAGTETSFSQRDVALNVTVLNGDLAGNDGAGIFTDNSFHVIDATGTNPTALIDGFTVRGGNANGGGANQDRGGGILCIGASPSVRSCAFRENRCTFGGGAGYINSASPVFLDCRFEANVGGAFGGAFDTATNSNTIWRRCVFIGNSAARAGAVEMFSSSNATLTNCLFWNNTSTGAGGGGAMYISSSSPVIRNCTIAGNRSTVHAAGGILATNVYALSNNIVYFNEGPGGAQALVNNLSGGTATWCCVQGIVGGSGNTSANPNFANLAGGDLHLGPGSPATDAGANALVPAGTTIDLEGNPRFADDPLAPNTGAGTLPIVDMGALERPNPLYAFFCAGDGSLPTPCPCANIGGTGRGCLNSDVLSQGALLVASGAVSPDSVVLTASDMLPMANCIFLQGDQLAANGIVFGDGVRCVDGNLKRLYLKTAVGTAASAPGAGDLPISAVSASLGDPIAAGTQRYYQVYYRDPSPAFCAAPPGDTWNVSSGVILNW